MSSELEVRRLGLIAYEQALELQSDLHARRVSGQAPDTLLLLEHPHTYTIGRRGSASDVLLDEEALASQGIRVVPTDRGGQVTYHGPGQLVAYPIIDLGPAADLVAYLRRLEDVMIAVVGRYGISGSKDDANTGVWVGGSKIGAIGVRVARSVTKHGFALNVSTDLSYFAGIIPCGITDRGVTSVANEVGWAPSMDEVCRAAEEEFARVFDCQSAAVA